MARPYTRLKLYSGKLQGIQQRAQNVEGTCKGFQNRDQCLRLLQSIQLKQWCKKKRVNEKFYFIITEKARAKRGGRYKVSVL
jgi:hypothetical protein